MLAVFYSLLVAGAAAASSPNILHRRHSVLSSHSTTESAPPVFQTHIATFAQRTNHFPNVPLYANPPSETFVQQYAINDTFYVKGGPVFMLDSGETSVYDRLPYLWTGVIAELAQATGGLGLIIEHRYYGTSFPVTNVTTDNLRWLATEQSIADIAYFAQNVVIPGHEDEDLTAPGRPWIIYGGSLAGAEVAFTMKTYPDIIYGGISSSGTVYSTIGYPEWYYNIQKYAPQDCVTAIENIVDKIDYLIDNNETYALTQLKTIFGLEVLQDIRDFALTIAFPIGNPDNYPTNTWQELNWDPNVGSNDFFYFCSNVTNPSSPPNVTAVDSLLAKYTNGESWTHLGNYAQYIQQQIIPLCPEGVSLDSNDCFGTHNVTFWADVKDLSGFRSYNYQSCTEMGFYSQGAPPDRRTLLSRSIQPEYSQRWCVWSFAPGAINAIPEPYPDTNIWNQYGGLNIEGDRLAQVDGGEDPWEYACVHSPVGPQVKAGRNTTLEKPFYLIEQGGHHWDENGLLDISLEPPFIQAIHDYEIEFVKSWLDDFDEWAKNKTKNTDL